MNRNRNESGDLDANYPFSHPMPVSGKPSPAPGLSRPRLVKVRKHQSRIPARDHPDRTDDGGVAQEMRDRLYTWNPFALEAGSRVSESSAYQNSGNFDSPKTQSAGFVSSNGSKLNLNSQNIGYGKGTGSFGSAVSVFDTGSVFEAKLKETGDKFSFAGGGSRNSDSGPFEFGSRVKKSSDTNMGNLGPLKSENVDFVFGASTSNVNTDHVGMGSTIGSAFSFTSEANGKNGSNSSKNSSFGSDGISFSQLPDEMRKLKLESTGNRDGCEKTKKVTDNFTVDKNNVFGIGGSRIVSDEECGNSDAKVFVYGNDSNLYQNSPLDSDEVLFSQLPDGLKKLNLQSTGNEDGHEKTKQATDRSMVDDVITGGVKISPSGECRDSDAKVFVSGSGARNSYSLSQNLSLGSDEGLFTQLPDRMRKPNLQTAGNDYSYKAKQATNRPTVYEGKFIFGGSKSAPNQASGNTNTSAFVSESGMKNRSTLSQNSSLDSADDSLSRLADEMRMFKLQNPGDGISLGKVKQDDHRSMVDKNKFLSTDHKNGADEESRNSHAGVFAFGGSVTNSSSLSQNTSLDSDEGLFSQIPYEMSKLNLQTAGNEDKFEKTKQADCRSKVDKNSIYIFGHSNIEPNSCSNASSKLPEAMEKLNIGSKTTAQNKKVGNVLPEDVKKSSIGRKAENSVSSTIQGFSVDALPADESTTFKFSFQAGIQDHSSSMSSIPQSQPQGYIRPDSRSMNPGFLVDGLPADEPTTFKFSFQAGEQDHRSSTSANPQSQTQGYIRPFPSTTLASHPSCFESVGTEPTFPSMVEELIKQPHVSPKKQDTSFHSTENLFTGPYQKMTFDMKNEDDKGAKTRKRRGRSRQSASILKQSISTQKNSQENLEIESPSGYSPMDYSPYQENLVPDQCSGEASIASDESIRLVSRGASTDSHVSVFMDEREEELVSAAQQLNISDGGPELREMNEDSSKDCAERNFATEFSSVDVRTSGVDTENFKTKDEMSGFYSDNRTITSEAEINELSTNTEKDVHEGATLFPVPHCLEGHDESNFTFAASTSAQRRMSASKHHYRRRSSLKPGQDSYSSLPNGEVPFSSSSYKPFPVASTYVHPNHTPRLNGTPLVHQAEKDYRAKKSEKPEASQDSITNAAASIAAQEACEKWRLRGNQAYADGNLTKAEDYYTRGVNSISQNETSRSCVRALMLCYSNRAATRMSLGRMREAICDCKMAIAIDPLFLRAQIRAANCHLALGEIDDALKHFKKCLESENDVKSDRKIITEASEGLRKAQQVADCLDQCADILLKRKTNHAAVALETISEALSISPHSESLMEMKAEALLMLRNYEEVIQWCEKSLDSDEKNSIITGVASQLKVVNSFPEKLWRWHLISKSYFYLGKLDEALELLQEHEKAKPVADKFQTKAQESLTSISGTIRELLRLKAAGNDAFQAGRHLEAVEHYTAALACNSESRPFAAICFCNRAAAYQALGQITDAIADCTLSVALDASYPKAISRRATLHEMIRDYGQAASDLNRLISLLERKLKDKSASAALVRSTSNSYDLNQARLRLSRMEEESRKETALDMYMILGIGASSSAAEVKKAYRKAALRHHPDKAVNLLARNENVDDGLWREVADEVHMDADRLFKMIGEAYTVLSDPIKRLQYDEEEEVRRASTTRKGYNGSSAPKTSESNFGNSHYEKSTNSHQRRGYGSSHHRWSEYSRSDW